MTILNCIFQITNFEQYKYEVVFRSVGFMPTAPLDRYYARKTKQKRKSLNLVSALRNLVKLWSSHWQHSVSEQRIRRSKTRHSSFCSEFLLFCKCPTLLRIGGRCALNTKGHIYKRLMWHSYRQSFNRSVPLKQVVLGANNCAKSYVTHIALSFMFEHSENLA